MEQCKAISGPEFGRGVPTSPRGKKSLTAMAATKFDWRFWNRKHRDTIKEQKKETNVWTMKMKGMMARSVSFSAVSWDPSFVKTEGINRQQ